MVEPQTWRELLRTIIENTHKRQWLASTLEISLVTITRWLENETNPRPQKLFQLLDALPEHQGLLLKLIQKEFPDFIPYPPIAAQELYEIPAQLYVNVLHTAATTVPIFRQWTISRLILRQAVEQLDPFQQGIAVMTMLCTVPPTDRKVRSLRSGMGQGTDIWVEGWEQFPIFLGIESLTGYAVTHGHLVMIPDLLKEYPYYPARHLKAARSAIAAPIRRIDGTAGCLYICSTQADYFTRELRNLVQNYADLLTLAFDNREFYDSEHIELGIMPPWAHQTSYIARFQQCLTATLKEIATLQLSISNQQAQLKVWQQIENELLQLAYRGTG